MGKVPITMRTVGARNPQTTADLKVLANVEDCANISKSKGSEQLISAHSFHENSNFPSRKRVSCAMRAQKVILAWFTDDKSGDLAVDIEFVGIHCPWVWLSVP